ncbi:transglutaminase family protein [Flavobacterium sp.]|uniref:transglutaminase family protein n=1 Tax=Flavobacterium sp. TaxID=239 RepID=UPI003D6A2C48
MTKNISIILLLLFSKFCVFAQNKEKLFEQSYTLLNSMIENENNYSFKKAVFSAENAYLEDSLDTLSINKKIKFLNNLSQSLIKERFLAYVERDKEKVNKWASVFEVMHDTIPVNINDKIYKYEPFGYDFNDTFGHNKRENLFVSKLLETRKGNCHSLPYLYKILAEELGVEANLALAPNHVYIKHRNIKNGWYNTELTSGMFPIDSWIMASGFVHIDAITNGVYMKALNNKESIALVLIDLADNYNAKYPNNDGTFVLKCCETAIKTYPNFATALILRAETRYNQIEKIQDKAKHDLEFKNLEKEYAHIHQIGYRNMPEDMYLNWLVTLKTERDKYENKNLNTFTKQK